MSEERKQNIIGKAYWWLYKKPSYVKSNREHVIEVAISLTAGGLIGYGMPQLFIMANPLYLLVAAPGLFHLGMISRNMHKGNIEHRKRNEAFAKTHDGMDILTWAKAHETELTDAAKAIGNVVEANLQELKKRGLVKENKTGEPAWYTPEDKIEAVMQAIKEFDEKAKKEKENSNVEKTEQKNSKSEKSKEER